MEPRSDPGSERPPALGAEQLGELAVEVHLREFEERFGAAPGGPPIRFFFSPGRVNLMGAHLDYNGGVVMPMAIDRGTFIALRERADRRVQLESTLSQVRLVSALDGLPPGRTGSWHDYPVGVFRALLGGLSGLPSTAADAASNRSKGLDVLYGGNLAIGAGLSSSASICVGTALALDRIWELGLGPLDRVRLALWAEREFVEVRCGIMDPFAVGLSRAGHLLALDCTDESTAHLPLDFEQVCIAVVDTGVRRELARSEFNLRVAQCREAFDVLRDHAPQARNLSEVPLVVLEEHQASLDAVVERRARHVLQEVERTRVAMDALSQGDLGRFGDQMWAAHASLRDLYEVSVPELDCLVEAAQALPGVFGSRLTGAGFGGCTVVLLQREVRDALREHLEGVFSARFGRLPQVGFFGGDPGPREWSGADA